MWSLSLAPEELFLATASIYNPAGGLEGTVAEALAHLPTQNLGGQDHIKIPMEVVPPSTIKQYQWLDIASTEVSLCTAVPVSESPEDGLTIAKRSGILNLDSRNEFVESLKAMLPELEIRSSEISCGMWQDFSVPLSNSAQETLDYMMEWLQGELRAQVNNPNSGYSYQPLPDFDRTALRSNYPQRRFSCFISLVLANTFKHYEKEGNPDHAWLQMGAEADLYTKLQLLVTEPHRSHIIEGRYYRQARGTTDMIQITEDQYRIKQYLADLSECIRNDVCLEHYGLEGRSMLDRLCEAVQTRVA